MANVLYFPKFRAFDSNGDPLAGGKVYTYEAGTTTPKDTYTDSTMGTPNSNPVILDSQGYASIWVDGDYKIIIKDSNDVLITTVDNFTNDSGTPGPAGTFQIATAGGTVNAITATYSPVVTLSNLTTVAFVALGANTSTTPTFSPDGLAAKTITKKGGVALKAGDIPAALAVCIVEYNSANTRWELLNPASDMYGAEQTIASATTTDLGTSSTNTVLISGTTTITGFGSSASTSAPIYFIRFSGALTLTYNATSLIIPGSASITTANGDTAIVEYLGSGNWKVLHYTKASGLPIVNPTVQTFKFAKYTHDLSSGTDGGTTTATAWTTRPINTEVYDADNIGTLSSNAVTLGAGTYYMTAVITFGDNGAGTLGTKARIRNTSDSTDVGFFQTGYSNTVSATEVNYQLFLTKEKITIATSKTFEIQYYVAAAQTTTGLGKAYSAPGTIERYAEWIIEQVS